jgi:hypothetical protein
MALSLTTADKILKVLYLPPVREMLNNSTVLLSRLEKDSSTQTVSGKEFTIPLHNSRNSAAAIGRGEAVNLTLPTPGNQGYVTAVVPNKYIYGGIKVTGPVLAATKGSANAFVEALTSEMQGLVKDTRKAFNRQLHGDGIDALAYVAAASTGPIIFVDDNLGNQFTHLPAGDAISIDILNQSSSYAVLATGTITRGAATGTPANTFVTSGPTGASFADGNPVVNLNTVFSGVGYSLMGIAGIIDNTDPPLLAGGLHSRTVAADPKWVAQVIGSDSSLQDLSFPFIQSGLSELAINSDFTEQDVALFLMNYAVRDKFVELCTNERTWFNTMKIDGGFEAVEYNGKPFVPDPQCRHNRMYGIVPETMKIYRSSDFDWMDRDGAVLQRTVGEDSYYATLFHYGDLGVSQRNGNIVYKGIRE